MLVDQEVAEPCSWCKSVVLNETAIRSARKRSTDTSCWFQPRFIDEFLYVMKNGKSLWWSKTRNTNTKNGDLMEVHNPKTCRITLINDELPSMTLNRRDDRVVIPERLGSQAAARRLGLLISPGWEKVEKNMIYPMIFLLLQINNKLIKLERNKVELFFSK